MNIDNILLNIQPLYLGQTILVKFIRTQPVSVTQGWDITKPCVSSMDTYAIEVEAVYDKHCVHCYAWKPRRRIDPY